MAPTPSQPRVRRHGVALRGLGQERRVRKVARLHEEELSHRLRAVQPPVLRPARRLQPLVQGGRVRDQPGLHEPKLRRLVRRVQTHVQGQGERLPRLVLDGGVLQECRPHAAQVPELVRRLRGPRPVQGLQHHCVRHLGDGRPVPGQPRHDEQGVPRHLWRVLQRLRGQGRVVQGLGQGRRVREERGAHARHLPVGVRALLAAGALLPDGHRRREGRAMSTARSSAARRRRFGGRAQGECGGPRLAVCICRWWVAN
mmetsp:Transcript_25637/g.86423  ORF Transcript_25637/g.86423 Transcript_25637/m.86423 type:complete len:256 (-) Transcript_25637:273-1040(-)